MLTQIDVLDPSHAPATGTPETGGWTTREMRSLIHGLKGLNVVGFDVVEVRLRVSLSNKADAMSSGVSAIRFSR